MPNPCAEQHITSRAPHSVPPSPQPSPSQLVTALPLMVQFSGIGSNSQSLSGTQRGARPLEFDGDWGKGKVFDWYRERQTSPDSVLVDQLIIYCTKATVPHRFVVARLRNKEVFRFDRHPRDRKASILMQRHTAVDEYEEVKPDQLEDLQATNIPEMELSMPNGTTLLHIISACFSLAEDKEALNYELLKYNCYFFAWTIVMIVTRHTHPFLLPSLPEVTDRAGPMIDKLADFITQKIFSALQDFVIHAVTTFRAETGRKLDKGLSKRELLVWKLPIGAVKWALSRFFEFRFHLDLQKKLKGKVIQAINGHLKPVLGHILDNRNKETKTQVLQHLWIGNFSQEFKYLTRGNVLKYMWSALFDIIVEGYGIKGEELIEKFKDHHQFRYRLKYRLCGKKVIQFIQLCDDGLHDALFAARERFREMERSQSIPNDPQKMHEAIFMAAFTAGSEAARTAAKATVAKTSEAINDQKRDAMWNEVFKDEIWNKVWESTRDRCCPVGVELIEAALQQISDVAAQGIMEEIQAKQTTQTEPVDGVVPLASIQMEISRYIKEAPLLMKTSNPDDAQGICSAMTRAWKHSLDTYKPLGGVDISSETIALT